MPATKFNHVSIQAGNLVEVDWPDVSTLDRSVVTDIRKLADDVPQTGAAQSATLFLDR
jgi:hypothetical protein